MSFPILSVEGLSKSYLVGHKSASTEQYIALRDVIGRNLKNFGRKVWDTARGRQVIEGDVVEEYWALRDLSFEVNEGEVLGVIGRNGAGKSTLLKILSRITEPTRGRVTLRGRVASLLEVGTGFHPELTGRENIFLNGAILGMTRSEIKRKFDEIVDFAGVDKFLDTPVKRYSSGMYVRLAFSVAAHLDPEILVVDEVLAVGDAEFQKKCLGKMKSVAHTGRTVLFVSHQLNAVEALCSTGILLIGGCLDCAGPVQSILSRYRATCSHPSIGSALYSDEYIDLRASDFTLEAETGKAWRLTAILEPKQEQRLRAVACIISHESGQRTAVIDCTQQIIEFNSKPGRSRILNIEVESLCLMGGNYTVDWYIEMEHFQGNLETNWNFRVSSTDQQKGSKYDASVLGLVVLDRRVGVSTHGNYDETVD